MVTENISIGNWKLKVYSVNTLIIGSGAAALNAAVSLRQKGIDDMVIATAQYGGGTSNNAGSDKQTYYKLSLSGKEPDSVYDMATDLFNGHCMHGDIALSEAQGSVRSFMRLVELGVAFPRDKYGSFAGYKTDHDPRTRATSAGPYTSHQMFKALASEIKKEGIEILDRHQFTALFTNREKTRVVGALAINLDVKNIHESMILFNAENIILGTGGPAGIYETSVYPESQTGCIGLAFMVGATGQNLTESQFGIASTRFRWNLSGSYQQVIPRYISTDAEGNDEKEFLNDHFPDINTLTRAIFLKGYQWPFDPRKISGYGSSLIDLLVDKEINNKKRRVFIDFTRNPTGRNGEKFTINNLDPLAADYLRNSGALKDTPVERLQSINKPAFNLYLDHGIDLGKEFIEIAVCAQHNNGGLTGNIWWESNIRHLFPVGEVNGSHGVYRPGGSALNAGQVGSARAAEYIADNYSAGPATVINFIEEISGELGKILDRSENWISGGKAYSEVNLKKIRRAMSLAGGITRSLQQVKVYSAEAFEMLELLPSELGATNTVELAGCFLQMEHCLTHYIYLKAVEFYILNGGRSRGSYIVTEQGADDLEFPSLCDFSKEAERDIIEVNYKNDVTFRLVATRDIPVQDLWFEKVWKDYLEDISARK